MTIMYSLTGIGDQGAQRNVTCFGREMQAHYSSDSMDEDTN
jgi:hypothetical protein